MAYDPQQRFPIRGASQANRKPARSRRRGCCVADEDRQFVGSFQTCICQCADNRVAIRTGRNVKEESRDTGLFSSPDPNLESEVREVAEKQLQESALQDGILKTAAENARGTILSLLQGLGFREIEIR